MNSKNRDIKQVIRIFFLILSLLSGGLIFNEQITVGFGFLPILGIPFFVISTLVAVLITTKSKIKFVHKQLGGLFVWLISMSILISTLFIVNKIRNMSPVLFSTKFYWEEGVDVEFRKNGTFKALNHHVMGGNLSYGKYKLVDSLIILKDRLKFGMENMNDTLVATNKGVLFKMEKPWRINEGKMSFEYMSKTEIDILNNTDSVIDSILINMSYTKQKIDIVSIGPKQKASYKFDMSNPYVNGKYILSYKMKSQENELKKIRNILDGYPLETVKSLRFDKDKITINLVFGNEILLPYQ
jgi:hypothetical protein